MLASASGLGGLVVTSGSSAESTESLVWIVGLGTKLHDLWVVPGSSTLSEVHYTAGIIDGVGLVLHESTTHGH